jgi:hypothetical protein
MRNNYSDNLKKVSKLLETTLKKITPKKELKILNENDLTKRRVYITRLVDAIAIINDSLQLKWNPIIKMYPLALTDSYLIKTQTKG